MSRDICIWYNIVKMLIEVVKIKAYYFQEIKYSSLCQLGCTLSKYLFNDD